MKERRMTNTGDGRETVQRDSDGGEEGKKRHGDDDRDVLGQMSSVNGNDRSLD